MKNYIVYNTITGEIVNNVSTQNSDNFSPYPLDFIYLEVPEPIDDSKYYIDPKSKEFIAFPDKPDQYHTWNWTTKTWQDLRTDQQKYNQAASQIQKQRAQLLTSSDWVVVKAMDQGTQVPPDWSNYRQELRDITQQSGYPFTVTWSTPPQQ
jgi:hypothetical protein